MRVTISILLVLIPLVSVSQKLKPERLGHIHNHIHESSGLEVTADSGGFWTIGDGGNGNLLLRVSGLWMMPDFHLGGDYGFYEGKVTIENITNGDWEDLAKDSGENIYIGDFGNNLNRRLNLVIYKVTCDSVTKAYRFFRRVNNSCPAQKISFSYPDQKQFPPLPSNWNFDCEAFFHHGDSLYLFSKNISNPNDGYTKMYRLPDQAGDYKAELIDSFYLNEPVTSADISHDGKTMVLLTYFSLWVFKDFHGNNFFKGKVYRFPFKGFTQKEAICFANGRMNLFTRKENFGLTNDDMLFMTDERHFLKGGKLYLIDLNQLDFSQPAKKFKSQFCKRAIYNLVNNPKVKYRKIMNREAAQ